MDLVIKATNEERHAVAMALVKLNGLMHIKSMSQSIIAEQSAVKQSKVRIALQDMLDDGEIEQYDVNKGKQVRRYYYVLTDKGINTYLKS